MSLVLDNSVTMRWYFGDGKPADLAYAKRTLDAIKNSFATVPVTWGLEVANVLAKAEAKGLATQARSESFVRLLQRMDIQVDTATFGQSLTATLHVARQYNLSAYDASYLELALRNGYPLASLDEALQKAAKQAGVKQFR